MIKASSHSNAINNSQKKYNTPLSEAIVCNRTGFLLKAVSVSLFLLLGSSGEAIAENSENAKLRAEINALKKQLNQLETKLFNPNVHHKVNHHNHVKPAKRETAVAPTSPDKKFHLHGVTITPGGFFAGEGVARSRNIQSDIASSFNAIPLANNPLYYMKEFRLSGRQSRISAEVVGHVTPSIDLTGFGELDFLGNGTGNSNESNSFDLRFRAFYALLDQNNWGFHVLAGQNWTLLTTNARNFKGSTPRGEIVPPTIEAQYVVGFVWKRQAQFRFVKDFGEHFWAEIAIENPQTTFGGIPAVGNGITPLFSNVIAITTTAPGAASLPSVNLFSLNHVPDVTGKVAYETTFNGHKVHLEAIGLYRSFYDRVRYGVYRDFYHRLLFLNNFNTNFNTSGWGVGAGGILQVIPNHLDVQGNVLAGRGIGSYASGQLPDVTIDSRGALLALPEIAFSVGATWHATEALDVYVYGGSERQRPRFFQIGQNFFGYGIPIANNSGCRIENIGVCAGNTRYLWQITTGLWDKVYAGIYGELRAGLQYSYTERAVFPGNNNAKTIPIGFKTNDNMVFGSLRYYPFV